MDVSLSKQEATAVYLPHDRLTSERSTVTQHQHQHVSNMLMVIIYNVLVWHVSTLTMENCELLKIINK